MFKKIVILLSTIVLTFAFVTHQPKKVDAAASTVVSFAAKQALKAATKSAVADTVGSLALKTASKEVAENYVKKEGLNLVVLEGGKKAMVKTTMNQTEKVALKKEIDNVIDLKIYGNAPGWVKFIDWFIGVGAVVLVGQVLYAAVTGEMSDFISEIFNEAMANLGWLVPAVPLGDNGAIPDKDPVKIPNDSPVVEPDHPTNPVPVPDYSRYVTYRSATSTGKSIPNIVLNVPSSDYVDHNGFVWSAEVQHDHVYSDTLYPYIYTISTNGTSYSPVNFLNLRHQNELQMGFSSSGSFRGSIFVKDSYLTVKLGSTYLLKNDFNTSSLRTISLPQTFESKKYNKMVVQNNYYDLDQQAIISRFIMLSTVFDLPTLSVLVVTPFKGDTVLPSENRVDTVDFKMFSTSSSISLNPLNIRLGIHTSMDMALDVPYLPIPEIGSSQIKVPMISPETGKIAWPQKSIFPDGYTYNPETQEILDPVGNPVTNPETIPELNPDPVVETAPNGEQVIDGVPTGQPAPEPVSPPTGGGGGDPITTGDPKEINWAKLKGVPMILTKKFPFSLPWDAQRFMQGVFGDVPQAEEINFKIDKLAGIHFGLDIKIPPYFDSFFDFSRQATVILFDIGLIYALYRLLGGAS